MAKKGINDLSKECPICGSIIWGKGINVLIEGANIVVCPACAKHGKKVLTPKKSMPKRTKSVTSQKKFKTSDYETNFDLVEDYDHKIRRARQTLKLNQEQFAQKLNEKPSLIRRIESHKVEPTISLAKKIENFFNIKLLKKIDEVEASVQTDKFLKKSSGSSLGDVAFIKRRDKKK
ncbi:MAG: multiprotein bridging factor aMBF1 [Promethearchaeota archaeon]